MAYQFEKHYSVAEARKLLPDVRGWLKDLRESGKKLRGEEQRLSKLVQPGRDVGGEAVNQWVRTLAALQTTLYEFYKREIQIKDLDRGLLDFPALRDGNEVFLCWEESEPDIAFWHDLESGFAGRERLEE